MKKFLLLIPLFLLVAGLVFAQTFTSEIEAKAYQDNYKYPVFGTAKITEITTILDSQEYKINYLLSYNQDGENKTENVQMMIYGSLPEDKIVEEKINSHALDYWATVLNRKPEPVINLVSHSLIGKVIEIKEPVKEVVEEPIKEVMGK